MDLASLDATMDAAPGKHHVMTRKQHGGQRISLTDQQYRDLITVQLADWLEQVHCALLTLLFQPHLVAGYARELSILPVRISQQHLQSHCPGGHGYA